MSSTCRMILALDTELRDLGEQDARAVDDGGDTLAGFERQAGELLGEIVHVLSMGTAILANAWYSERNNHCDWPAADARGRSLK